jgi:hypothetical protein
MISFRTEIFPQPSDLKLTHQSPLLFLGSCFTENIGAKLEELAFPVMINPTGIVYNPLSVKRSLELLLEDKDFNQKNLDHFNDLYFSFDHDSSFSRPSGDECLSLINHSLHKGNTFFKITDTILLSFGTAWVYYHKKQNRLVSNCHKIPSGEFERKLLTPEEIVSEFSKLIKTIRDRNADMRFIFTISPVRHWKDGAVGNQISKSVLVLAINSLVQKFPGIVEYFPAYELMLDDLRDYRFYADDLLHPSDKAIQYIWGKFSEVYFSPETISLNKEITSLLLASRHRPLNDNPAARKRFLAQNFQKTQNLKKDFPYLDLGKFEEFFSEQNFFS